MIHQDLSAIGTLALDFDGVICDGLREYFQASCRAARKIWPDLNLDASSSIETRFQALRPVITHGWEMPLLIRALAEDGFGADLEQDWPQVRQAILDRENLEATYLGSTLDQVRDEWIARDWQGWMGLHQFYPGIVSQLQAWADQNLPWVIITTKETRFVEYLLSEAQVSLPPLGIYGKDSPLSKVDVLLRLHSEVASPIWFVEDRWDALVAVQAEPQLAKVELFLAAWGYTTAETRRQAQVSSRVRLLSLQQFGQEFSTWLGE